VREASPPLPLYEYRCTRCGFRFEKIQHFDAQPEVECPKCHGVLERPLTAPALQFKGAGWYVNDYAPKPASSLSDDKPPTAASAPSDTKTGATEPTSKPAASEGASKAASAESPAKSASTAPSSSD
jgi:putative FmdB family regulatory protein